MSESDEITPDRDHIVALALSGRIPEAQAKEIIEAWAFPTPFEEFKRKYKAANNGAFDTPLATAAWEAALIFASEYLREQRGVMFRDMLHRTFQRITPK